ncbi:DUF4307 domain-containing protein [Streptomyces uncialis]|uniref:DUF4307 domain-containing protein n=1 Tax=Streptomyces uncialis TaxID=1048205 RepID=UPI002E302562|nr:DUF4307 domain-containing protein [Streptomyces uncialis]
MSAVREQPPEGRYGRSAEERTDRRLRVTGAVLGAGLLGLVTWIGYGYISSQTLSGEMIRFKVVSDRAIETHLEVRKDSEARGFCTVRAQSEDGAEVGRADFRFDQRSDRVDEVVTLRTTARATAVELVGCESDT